MFLIILPLLAFLSYSSSPGGIKSNILLSIPETHPTAIIVSIMMFLSCLFTYPIYSPPLNEVLEETIKNKRTTGIFVSDPTRLMYRILQTLMISLVAWFCPFFGDIISLDILESIRLIVPSFYLVALCLQLSLVWFLPSCILFAMVPLCHQETRYFTMQSLFLTLCSCVPRLCFRPMFLWTRCFTNSFLSVFWIVHLILDSDRRICQLIPMKTKRMIWLVESSPTEYIHSNVMSTIEEPTIHRIESFEIEKKIEANNEATIDKKEVVPTQPPAVVEDIPTVSYLTLKQVVNHWKSDHRSLLLLWWKTLLELVFFVLPMPFRRYAV